MITVNIVIKSGLSFKADTNKVKFFTREDEHFMDLPLIPKEKVAHGILDAFYLIDLWETPSWLPLFAAQGPEDEHIPSVLVKTSALKCKAWEDLKQVMACAGKDRHDS